MSIDKKKRKPEKNFIRIPVLKDGEIVQVKDPRRIDIYIGITDVNEEAQALYILQTEIKKNPQYNKIIISNSCKEGVRMKYTTELILAKDEGNIEFIENKKKHTQKWTIAPEDERINTYTHKGCNKYNAMILDNIQGYEKIFWFTGIKA